MVQGGRWGAVLGAGRQHYVLNRLLLLGDADAQVLDLVEHRLLITGASAFVALQEGMPAVIARRRGGAGPGGGGTC